jgi:CRISPR-associated protein Csm1
VLDLEGDGTGDPASSIVAAFRGRHVPLDPATNKVVEFNELAKKSTGREALACLKMDVDNLGYVFSQGLKGSPNSSRASDRGGEPDRTSISRVATLSRTLETFFSGYLECLLRGEFSDVYLVYCGGDDLAAIGPWDKVFALALRIREDFRRFTGGNPAWTLSAGIAVTNPGVPVLVALAQAEDFLEASKRLPGPEILPWPSEHSEGDPQKDRLTAFGTSIPWSEYPGVDNQAKRVLRWLEDGTLKTSKVRRLLWFAEMARKFQRTRQTRYLEYLPLLVRELRRNWGEQTESQREARQWAAGLTLPSPEAMRPIRFVCEYALYGIRGKQGD